MLLNEALHYKAWVAAGSPVSVSIDSVSFVCQDANAVYFCNQAGVFTNKVYNALIAQFTTAGAPYSNDYFLMATHNGDPRLWIKSLEDFSQTAGDYCNYPLTSEVSGTPGDERACGITAGYWNDNPHPVLTYRGYKDWALVNSDHLNDLLNGWNSGTAGNFLETVRGFKNMKNKVIISTNIVPITLANYPNSENFIPFIDTDFDYSFQPGLVDDNASFNRMTTYQYAYHGCRMSMAKWDEANNLPNSRNQFYHITINWGCPNSNNCDGCLQYPDWHFNPGWHGSTKSWNAIQFRWPAGTTALFTDYSTHNRSSKNVAGVWTMCGDDFTAWLENIVPRPPTCDDPSFGSCSL
jgi:hypothetical protein